MKRVCIALVRFYQKYLSPRKRHPSCRYTPTCSCYALEAFEKRGFFVGLALAVWRILRCNPFSPGGYDPVPDRGFGRKIKYRDLDRLAAEMRKNGEMLFDYETDDSGVGTREKYKPKKLPKYDRTGDKPKNP